MEFGTKFSFFKFINFQREFVCMQARQGRETERIPSSAEPLQGLNSGTTKS